MITYKLLTPGPLTTTETVKKEMLTDHCTWDDDYKSITQKIRKELLELAHVSEEEYTVVLMQGSGTFGVESAVTSSVGPEDKILVCENGAYGERMAQIAKQAGKNVVVYHEEYSKVPDAEVVKKILAEDPEITHVGMIHSETTSGILNDIEAVGKVVKEAGKTFLVDGMSSFGGVDMDLKAMGIDFIISSSNKCIQGVPGFSYIICRIDELKKCEGKCGSHSLDLYDQWKTMKADGKWRFTSPTHVVLAFAKALEELKEEGGIPAREKRYRENNKRLIQRLAALGIKTYIDAEHQGPIITTFFTPEKESYNFNDMYQYVKERGYAIYPGKVTNADTFRIGNIGEIYLEDIEKVCDLIQEYFESIA
ncbi:MAG: 2-aminoethylphosphonate--pyruvate transaminase [Lachnospiraceae bacterium]|nr:2-aminoethylphosphonate--pyruvate transaminase [Lachnospiraceae bacterium]